METPAVQLAHVNKVFGDRYALNDVSLELPVGSFLSIFGPNGAGKTTLLRILATLSRPSSGDVNVAGISLKDDADAAREQIGLISHNSMLYSDLNAEQNLQLYARLYGIQNAQERVDEMLEAVELSHRRLDTVRTFSRGMTQRLAIARALLHDPQVVLLDEPYSGLDPHAVDIFDSLLDAVRENRTFVMVSHDLRKGFESCSHAMVLARGKKVVYAAKEDIDYDAFAALYHETVGMGVA